MYSIGIDYHRTYSHMTVMDAQGQVVKAGKMPNTQEAVHRFVAPYGEDAQAVLEATRNWTVMYDFLEREVRAVYLAHPLKVRAIAEARIKTDRIDSRILAHLLRCDLLPTAYVRPREDRVNQQILRQRMFLVRVRTMVKNRIHVCIDRQLEVREGVAQFTDLFGAAGLTWLRRVALPEVERRLLNAELALFDAVQARIADSDALVRSRAAGAKHPRLRTLLWRLGGPRDWRYPPLPDAGEAQRLRWPGPLGARLRGEGVSWAPDEAGQQVAALGGRRSGAPRRHDRPGPARLLRAPALPERSEPGEGGHGPAPPVAGPSCAQPGAPIPEAGRDGGDEPTLSDCPHEPPTGVRLMRVRVPKKG